MGYRVLADAVALLHLAFVLFIPLGGLAVVRWPRLAWLHLGCALWGALIVWTPVGLPAHAAGEGLRVRGGETAYAGGFIRHYLAEPIFSGGMPRPLAWTLVSLALLANGWLYRRALRTWERRSSP
jgi:hypothetical protein